MTRNTVFGFAIFQLPEDEYTRGRMDNDNNDDGMVCVMYECTRP